MLLLMDVVISTLLYVVGNQFPNWLETVKWAVVTYQPVFIFLIGAIAHEDGKAKESGTFQYK